MKQDDIEKRKKAGNPLFIMIIFIVLIGFVFYVPDIYKKYNSNLAEFLGIGSDNNNKEENLNPDDYIESVSEFYQLGSLGTLEFNEITLSNIKLENSTLYLTVESDDKVNLNESAYYLEFYENRQVFKGRRILKGDVSGSLDLKIDVSNLDISTTTYMVVSRIEESSMGPIDMPSDESGIASLSCARGDYVYEYDFYLGKLNRVVQKYTYSNYDLNEYSKVIFEYQKLVNRYNELNGVTASIADNNSTFIFTSEFDYETISSFGSIQDEYIFMKDKKNNVVKFKMEAEGFDCE